jgi:hypothetical protein
MHACIACSFREVGVGLAWGAVHCSLGWGLGCRLGSLPSAHVQRDPAMGSVPPCPEHAHVPPEHGRASRSPLLTHRHDARGLHPSPASRDDEHDGVSPACRGDAPIAHAPSLRGRGRGALSGGGLGLPASGTAWGSWPIGRSTPRSLTDPPERTRAPPVSLPGSARQVYPRGPPGLPWAARWAVPWAGCSVGRAAALRGAPSPLQPICIVVQQPHASYH